MPRLSLYHRDYGIEAAKLQFEKDLVKDKDYIEFKEKSIGFGRPVITEHVYILARIGESCERIISNFLKYPELSF